jgi:beta-glucosidase-like glycosyl hydrolase
LPFVLFGSLEEKVGALFVAPACPLHGPEHEEALVALMQKCHIRNLLIKQGNPALQIAFLQRVQAAVGEPLFVMADYEWGLAMMMKEVKPFPKAKILGKTTSLVEIEAVGLQIAKDALSVGVHMNLAPVADVNNNPLNIVIGDRSFGDDPAHVADCVRAMVRGLQNGGVYATAKHFPGHGDTGVDSHLALPTIPFDEERLSAVELVPFRAAIQENVAAIMTGHLLVPHIDSKYPASLSRIWMEEYLRGALGFKGVIITDALNMKALTERYEHGDIAFLAVRGGADLLLYGDHRSDEVKELIHVAIPAAYERLLHAYREGYLSLEELDQKVERMSRLTTESPSRYTPRD